MPRGNSSSSSPRPRASKWLLRNYIISNMIWDPTRREEDLLAECIQLHYRSAAPLVMEYIDMVHDAALASPNRENCFGNAEAHGLGPDVGRRGLEILQRAMESADDAVIRRRVEKVSIACHALIVEPVVGPAFRKVRFRKKKRDESPFEGVRLGHPAEAIVIAERA